MVQLQMKRPTLTGIDSVDRPGPRIAGAGDAAALGRLLGAAFPDHTWSADRARSDLLDEPTVVATYVIDGPDGLIATASARAHPGFPGAGYVHWVGVDPHRRGQALGTTVMAAVMARFVADGLTRAMLETDDPRLPAITSYLAQGYVPHYPDDSHVSRWSAVFMALAAWRRGKTGV